MKRVLSVNSLAVLGSLLFLVLLDMFLFRFLLWQIPNESAWNTNHFYNFIYEWHRLESKPKTKPRIIIVGSSIAYYSMDQSDLKKEISKRLGQEVDVEYFSYAGKSPLYFYLFLDELWKLKPDMVVYPINFIDFRLHRAYILNNHNSLDTVDNSVLIADAVTEGEAPQAKYIFPWETLSEMWNYLSWDRRAELWIASLFKFYGYKDIYWEPLSSLYNHRFGRNSSYHGYAGVEIPERVNSLGWTGKDFSFPLTHKIVKEGFWIEVVSEILKKGPLSLSIRSSDGVIRETINFHSPGWQKVYLTSDFWRERNQDKEQVHVELSQTWNAYEADGFLKDYHWDEMGVRLTQIHGLDHPKSNQQYLREERKEDLRYLGMDDDTYRGYFSYRLLQDLHLRPGIGYLVELAQAKKRLNQESFSPMLHFQYLQKISNSFRKKEIPLLLINNPENPISLEWYKESKWYKGYLDYLQSMNVGSVHFVDLKDELKMQDFSDFHHFTFTGMKKMNSIYVEKILDFFAL